MIWNEHYECMEREKLLKLQGKRVKEMVSRVYDTVPFLPQKT
jgi:phenylacetate-CoA ligase